MKRTAIIFPVLVLCTAIAGNLISCKKPSAQHLKMATTTSTDNTGLLDYLSPIITKDTGIELQWVAVGTGKALELGKNCDVDVLLVHAPNAEKKYIAAGHGINRTVVMYNDFVIIGPSSDPAEVKGKSVDEFFKAIDTQKTAFASRGDNSGTNKKEIYLWKKSGLKVPDRESWYIQTGQGMLATLNIATEREAYTMTDRGTYIKYASNHKGNPPLKIMVEGDRALLNIYSFIEVNPAVCENANNKLAKKLVAWFVSDKAQKLIGGFKLMGKQLYRPGVKK